MNCRIAAQSDSEGLRAFARRTRSRWMVEQLPNQCSATALLLLRALLTS